MPGQPKPYPFAIRGLLRPEAYPHPASNIEVRETHISWVILAGDYAYKVKKPVDVGFLDFSTLERRRDACEQEVRLNRRLAPSVYLGVVDIVQQDDHIRIGGSGHVLDRAVRMRRLPDSGMLPNLLARDEAPPWIFRRLARLMADFHDRAPTGSGVDEHGSPAALRANWDQSFAQTARFMGRAISRWEFQRLVRWVHDGLTEHYDLLLRRVRDGRIRDGHGDLHTGSICVVGRRIIPFDCLEFAPRYRCGDVAAEVAFLAMDLDHAGRPDLAHQFVSEYVRRSGDSELVDLLPFYKTYRAFVRSKVHSLRLLQEGIDEAQAIEEAAEARSYCDLAASYTAPPAGPRLMVVAGLPASGKTTLARDLSHRLGMLYLSTDVIRKRLAGLRPTERATAAFGSGLYEPAISRRAYAELRRQASRWLRRDVSVVLDGTFGSRRERLLARDLARRAGAQFSVVLVAAPEEVRRHRMLDRERDPERVSDVTWKVAKEIRAHFEAPFELDPGELLLDPTGGAGAEGVVRSICEGEPILPMPLPRIA